MRQMTMGAPRVATPPPAGRYADDDGEDILAALWKEGDAGELSDRRADLIAALKQVPHNYRALLVLVSQGYSKAEACRKVYGRGSEHHASEYYTAARKHLHAALHGTAEQPMRRQRRPAEQPEQAGKPKWRAVVVNLPPLPGRAA